MVEPQGKSVVEYDKLSLRGEIVKMVANQLHNIVNLDKIEPVIDDIEQFILDLQKETDDKWKGRIEKMCINFNCDKCGKSLSVYYKDGNLEPYFG